MTATSEILDDSLGSPGEFIAPEPDRPSLTIDFDESKLPDLQVGKVCVVYCTRGEVRFEFTQSLIAMSQSSPNLIAAFGQVASGNLAVHRNETIETALTTGAEWVLMLDDDMQFPSNTIEQLIDVADMTGDQVVGGLYCNIGMDGNLIPMAYYFDPETDRVQPYSASNIGKLIHSGGISTLVDSTGCGCLLIHRDILVQMLKVYGAPMPWFANDIEHDLTNGTPVVQGEDHTFFRRLRQIGHRLQVRLDLDITHFKIMAIGNDFLLRQAEIDQENPE